MIVPLAVIILISASVAAQGGLPTVLEDETPPRNSSHLVEKGLVSEDSAEVLAFTTNYRYSFPEYEKRVKSFIKNVGDAGLTLKRDSEIFLVEMRPHLALLPGNETIEVTKMYRDQCHCHGRILSPCPDECIYSCYGYRRNYGTHTEWNNCLDTEQEITDCYCVRDSSIRCDNNKGIKNCIKERTELQQVNTTCSQHTINQTLLTKSYQRIVEVKLEPLSRLLRNVEHKLSSFKQLVIVTNALANITYTLCAEQNETPCHPEASNKLKQELKTFSQLKRNITMDMIGLQQKMKDVSNDITKLREDVSSQILAMIKNYACCLQGLDFSIKYNDCREKPPGVALLPSARPQSVVPICRDGFLCDHRQECLPSSLQCDGIMHCVDGSDERNC